MTAVLKQAIHDNRRVLIVLLHAALIALSNYCAFLLRFDGVLPPEHVQPFLNSLPWLLAIRGVIFWPFGLYRGLWRYASLWDLQNIIAASVVSTAAFTA